MEKCRNCQGDIVEGMTHAFTSDCIRILTARINAIFVRLGAAPPDQESPPAGS